MFPTDSWRHHDGDPATGPPPAPAPADPPTPAPPAPALAPAPPPAPPVPPAAPPPAPAPAAAPSFEDWAKDPTNAGFLKQTRDEAAGYRTKLRDLESRTAEERKQLAQLLGLEGGTPDPAKVAEQLKTELGQRDTELRQLRVDNALGTAVGKHGADPTLTRALLMMDGSLAKLDPSSQDFGAQVEAAVLAAITATPALKVAGQVPPAPVPSPPAAPAAPVSGGQFPGPGAPNGKPQLTREQLKGMSADEINQARADGKLDALLGRI